MEDRKKTLELDLMKAVEDIDRRCLRKLQIDMHKCSIKCCENDKLGPMEFRECSENCSIPLRKAQELASRHFNDFVGRFERCVQQCSDDAYGIGQMSNQGKDKKREEQMEKCSIACIEKMSLLIPNIVELMENKLKRVE